ncbi:S41 family peptidase [Geomonas sp. RF6]|uniref:S41 family peptidase n=1 Tax=Geomonas sp. RF6 TaxID=2897342 RepID=UPI001E3296AA|nr:S41 family peptidase [Geomonas sp. RF6]UFS71286.1 S41 family peptidase [Geomonas sp. RF6]
MPSKRLAGIAAAAAVVLVVAVLTVVPRLTKMATTAKDTDYLQLFQEAYTAVRTHYVEKVDDKKLMQGAISGMLSALDPHSTYLPVQDFNEMQVHIAGAFGGVGIELGMQNGKLFVNAPLEDTPAFRAGILAGDMIWKIDGHLTQGMTINDAVSRMRGTPGTPVTLGILRDGSPTPLKFHLVRATIKTRSLKGRLLEPGFAYIAIAEFQERTAEDFKAALQRLHAENGGPFRGLILDLRYNPGGLVEQAFLVADRFIGEGASENGLIVTTKGREPSSERSLSAYMGKKEPHYPMVVLVNGGSASASEIVAGALQDHKRAVIMGTQSFGKGSVQSIMQLRNGDGLKLTTARYYTPSGRSIQAKGITPDIVVEMRKQAPVKKKDEDELREKDLDGHMLELDDHPAKGTAKAVELKESEILAKDYQLSRALELLKGVDLMGASLKK